MKLVNQYHFENVYVDVFYPNSFSEEKRYPAIFLNDGNFLEINKMHYEAIIIGLTPANRNDVYSPFEITNLDTRLGSFGGKGREYNEWLSNVLLPFLLEKHPIDKERMLYGGVSLGGLEAIYSLFFIDNFYGVFSICGSFWFPSFKDFAKENRIVTHAKVVILNGEKEESKNHNSIFGNALEDAKEVAQSLNSKLIIDKYGHYGHIYERISQVLKVYDL